MEKIYIHKVRMVCENGWGQSQPLKIETLGFYKDVLTAQKAKEDRDASKDQRFCDVGSSWIETVPVM